MFGSLRSFVNQERKLFEGAVQHHRQRIPTQKLMERIRLTQDARADAGIGT